MKLFILGCGFLGSKLAVFFKEKGHLVTVSTTSPSKVASLDEIATEVVLLDDKTSLKDCLTHQEVLIVCVAPKNREDYQKTYLETAHRVKEALKDNRYIKAVFYTSSCSVYGDKRGMWVDETHPLEAAHSFQQTLIETEKVFLNQLPTAVRVCVFRLGEIYGLEKCIEEKMKKISGTRLSSDGESYTNLIHVTDVVRAIDWAYQKKLSGIFNLCNDSHEKRRDFYHKWCSHMGLHHVEFSPSPSVSIHGNKRVSNHKIKLMGFEFEHPMTDPRPLVDQG